MKAPPTAGRDALQRQVDHLTKQLKYSVWASNAIVRNMDQIILIKQAIEEEDLMYAEQLWDEIDNLDQQNLMRAYSKGGAFLAKERQIIKDFWRITVEEYEARKGVR